MGFVTNPVTGIISLAFLPIFDKSWELPNMSLACALGASITGIIILQLRITELTSPLTVAVLGVFHDLGIVLLACTSTRMSTSNGNQLRLMATLSRYWVFCCTPAPVTNAETKEPTL